MIDDFDAESAKSVIYDENINVTEPNPIKDFVQVIINIFIFIVSIYLFVYITSGIVLSKLPPDKQIVLEKILTPAKSKKTVKLSEAETQRLTKIKNKLLKIDPNFPKTSELKIDVIESEVANAFCYPDGHIYITSALYNELKSDEELTFIIAHEMAHYKYKDHLYKLRQNISNGVVVIILSVASPNSNDVTNFASGSLNFTELEFSRGAEKRADMYAISALNILYGNSKAGVSVMNKLKDKNSFNVEFLSTHPNIDRRIKYIERLSN